MLRHRIELFRLFGFSVQVDLTWVVLAVLITWSLATGAFPALYPELPASAAWAMGALTALGLFVSILFHELAHALVARHYGIPIRRITLFIFGGIAELRREPEDPEAELVMAAAGPVASLWLAGALGLGALWGALSGWPVTVTGILAQLLLLNGLLAAFNLVPAFPLDGGRMLRAMLWHFRRDLVWATRITSTLGRLFGAFLIALGVVAALSGSLVAGIWWALIGLLLRSAARVTYRQLILEQRLGSQPVERFMQTVPVAVPRALSVEELVDRFFRERPGEALPVVDDGRLVGWVAARHVRGLPREEWGRQSVGAVAERSGPENTVSPGSNALAALSLMRRTGLSRLLVAEGERLVGVLALTDLLHLAALQPEAGAGGSGGG